MEIKRTHSYNFQIQIQMKFCNTIYGDLIVCTNQDLLIGTRKKGKWKSNAPTVTIFKFKFK